MWPLFLTHTMFPVFWQTLVSDWKDWGNIRSDVRHFIMLHRHTPWHTLSLSVTYWHTHKHLFRCNTKRLLCRGMCWHSKVYKEEPFSRPCSTAYLRLQRSTVSPVGVSRPSTSHRYSPRDHVRSSSGHRYTCGKALCPPPRNRHDLVGSHRRRWRRCPWTHRLCKERRSGSVWRDRFCLLRRWRQHTQPLPCSQDTTTTGTSRRARSTCCLFCGWAVPLCALDRSRSLWCLCCSRPADSSPGWACGRRCRRRQSWGSGRVHSGCASSGTVGSASGSGCGKSLRSPVGSNHHGDGPHGWAAPGGPPYSFSSMKALPSWSEALLRQTPPWQSLPRCCGCRSHYPRWIWWLYASQCSLGTFWQRAGGGRPC